MVTDVQEASTLVSERELARQRRWVLGIVNFSHMFNHLNSGIVPILFTPMMGALGFGFAELGLMSAAHNVVSQGMQATYGITTQFVKRAVLLGAGNALLGVTTIVTGAVTGFSQLIVLRAISGMGSSPQHPVGSTMLSSWFEGARGRALGLHNTAGSVGTFLAPLVAGLLILYFDWRVVFVLIGIPSVVLGLSYFLLRDVVRPAPVAGGRALARAGWDAYLACLKNRNLMLISLLMMVGAAGRGMGINQTYLVPHFVYDLGIPIAIAATVLLTIVNVGGLVAPLTWGWLSDTFPRKLVMQASLLLSAATTVWIGEEAVLGVTLILSLAAYGLVVHSRQAITQAMVGDYAGRGLEDAAFSIYFTVGFLSAPLWTILMGAIMQSAGFAVATKVIAVSYLLGILILIPLRIAPRPPAPTAAA
ncbi:MAG: MFS transporter [Chloroflexi bacterium]|nr:MFS transporter [Chloroflexota bacterium]